MTKVVSYGKIVALPVFEPNEYLFRNFGHKGETKADVYAWAVRDAMARATKIRLYDGVRIRDKLNYQAELGLVRRFYGEKVNKSE